MRKSVLFWALAPVPCFFLVAAYGLVVNQLPENPHQVMNKEGNCLDCHRPYRGEVDPHDFFIDVSDDCMRTDCHQNITGRMKRNHPIGVDPVRSRWKITIPEGLPLDRGKISCGTCHQPHMDWLTLTQDPLSDAPAFTVEEKHAGSTKHMEYYMTHYLRIGGDQLGYEKLCLSCHPDMF